MATWASINLRQYLFTERRVLCRSFQTKSQANQLLRKSFRTLPNLSGATWKCHVKIVTTTARISTLFPVPSAARVTRRERERTKTFANAGKGLCSFISLRNNLRIHKINSKRLRPSLSYAHRLPLLLFRYQFCSWPFWCIFILSTRLSLIEVQNFIDGLNWKKTYFSKQIRSLQWAR